MTKFCKTITYNQNYALYFGYISGLSNCSGYSGSTPKKNQYLDISKKGETKSFLSYSFLPNSFLPYSLFSGSFLIFFVLLLFTL